MFFLLRMAFWLTIVLALLPAVGHQPTAQGPQVGEAITAAGAAVSDVRHFCDRQPMSCEVGSQVAVMIGQRAQAGAKMLYELINEHSGPTETGSVPSGKSEGQKSESIKPESNKSESAKPEGVKPDPIAATMPNAGYGRNAERR